MQSNTTSGSEREDADGDGHPASDPKTMISIVRAKQVAMLGSQQRGAEHSLDLDHLVRTVQALLVTNNEIGNKCLPHKQSITYYRNGKSGDWTFERAAVTDVRFNYNSRQKSLSFTTAPQLQRKDFGTPSLPPEQLLRLVSIERHTEGEFPDYKELFERSLVLHDDLLVPFLMVLKSHLEDIQVYLGMIDSWLAEPAEWIQFVQDQFDTVLDMSPRSLGQTHVLKSFGMPGEYRLAFDITNEVDRERLVKFHVYASSVGTTT